MAYKEKQKELKTPDEFQKLGAEAVPFLEQHGRQVLIGVGAVLAVGLIASVASAMSGRSDVEASRDFSAALKVLERNVGPAPADSKPKPGEENFETEAEKDEAIIKTLTEFRTKHSGKPTAVSAALPLAQALLRRDKPEMALPLIEEYLAKAGQNDPLRPAAFEARGYALEGQKKIDEALGAFEQLARENKTDFMKGMGDYHKARMLLMKGDTTAAAKTLSEIESAAPNTAAARLAKDRIAVLAAQGISIPKTEMAPAAVDAGK